MFEGERHRRGGAHRFTSDDRAGYSERVHDRCHVFRHAIQVNKSGIVDRTGVTVTALVVDHDAVPVSERCQLNADPVAISAKAVRENDGRSFAVRLDSDLQPVGSDAYEGAFRPRHLETRVSEAKSIPRGNVHNENSTNPDEHPTAKHGLVALRGAAVQFPPTRQRRPRAIS